MNIREIIKEEINDFKWADDIPSGTYQECSIFTDQSTNQLCKKISRLKTWLLYDLGMRNVIDEMLKDIKIVKDLTNKYQEPLKLLHDTGKFLNKDGSPKIKLVDGVYTHYRLLKAGLVLDESGEYHYVNKLNTNYSDLAELITELLVRGNKVDELVNKNAIGIKKYLENIKPVLFRLVSKYFKTEDLKQFIRNTVGLTAVGDDAEDYVSEILHKYGMTQMYQGGNGDFIDMLFGADLIMNYEGKTITCQVKSREHQAVSASKSNQYLGIDYFISPQNEIGNGIIIYKRSGKIIKIDDNGNIEQ